MDVVCSFIIGFPQDTPQTVQQSIALARHLEELGAPARRERAGQRGRVTYAFTILTPLPGTHLYDHAAELGLHFLTRDWDRYSLIEPDIETPQLNAAELRRWYFEATWGDKAQLLETEAHRAAESQYCVEAAP